ncbi:hypothetical protein AVEN_150773-1 [Araneus ventricosus]|uniref:Uncharacterized protein n=1 Tax=Araneus ventricosus TaxID=182803 RepID=A0A4Y2TY27_ARAVE|nr:hypothetical protein AVEN_150773-1 [Araneus ventricosus]
MNIYYYFVSNYSISLSVKRNVVCVKRIQNSISVGYTYVLVDFSIDIHKTSFKTKQTFIRTLKIPPLHFVTAYEVIIRSSMKGRKEKKMNEEMKKSKLLNRKGKKKLLNEDAKTKSKWLKGSGRRNKKLLNEDAKAKSKWLNGSGRRNKKSHNSIY